MSYWDLTTKQRRAACLSFWKKAWEYYETYCTHLPRRINTKAKGLASYGRFADGTYDEYSRPCVEGLIDADVLVNSAAVEVPPHVKGYFKRAAKKFYEEKGDEYAQFCAHGYREFTKDQLEQAIKGERFWGSY